jgi:hypothetical protein
MSGEANRRGPATVPSKAVKVGRLGLAMTTAGDGCRTIVWSAEKNSSTAVKYHISEDMAGWAVHQGAIQHTHSFGLIVPASVGLRTA